MNGWKFRTLKVTTKYTELNWQPATDNDQRNKPNDLCFNEYPVDTKKAENIAHKVFVKQVAFMHHQPWNAKKYFAVTAIDRCGNEVHP